MSKEPFSAVIISYNEASQIKRCLNSLKGCVDEILVVDSGSHDGTQEIVQDFGATLIVQKWLGFGPQKDFSVKNAKYDWVLCLDSDEELTDQLKENILIEMENPRCNAYEFNRQNIFLGKGLKHGAAYPDRKLRLFHREHAHWNLRSVHEIVETECKVGFLKGDLKHYSDHQGLQHYIEKQNTYTSIQAKSLQRPSYFSLILRPIYTFIKYFFLKRGFLDGAPGLVHILITSFNTFQKLAKAFENKREE